MSTRRRCPICRTELDVAAHADARGGHGGAARPPTWPFCSERCRVIDLGRWLGESYRLPDRPGADEPGFDDQVVDGEGAPHDDPRLLH